MTQHKIRLPAPFPIQQTILQGARRFNAVCMGEKGGKTTLGIEALVASRRGVLNGRAPVAWFSASKDELAKVRRRVTRALDPFIRRRVNARQLELHNGNTLSFFHLEEPLDVFEQFGLIVVDDVRSIANFLDLWEDSLSESLRVHRGQAWFLSSAYGKRNDFYRLFELGRGDPDWALWQFNSYANPHLPAVTASEAESVTELEWRQRFGAEFLDVAIELDATQRIIGHDETFLQWCERLEQTGLKVDGIPFTLSDRPAMRFVYDLIPATRQDAFLRTDVIMKCTQVGFTVMEMLAMIYLAIKFAPAKIGMFMPSQMLASGKSSERFMPIVKTVPEVHRLMIDKHASGSKGGEGNVLIRNLGPSRFHFLWTSGKTATESFPMDVVSFDEVQEMAVADMEKTKERLSASQLRYTLMGSTANWPDSDIHWWYKRGTQHQFHTRCPHCGTGQVLDEHFPQCIGYDPEQARLVQREGMPTVFGEYRYRCHSCSGWIDDPQAGEWIPRNPEAEIRSVHFPQFLSPTISAREMIESYRNADDMKNFFNRKLGKPYTDPSQVPVNLEMLNECARIGMEAGLVWERSGRGTFMGIDQMGQFNVVVIKKRLPDNRQAYVHIELIFNNSPFDRCSELMGQYGVQCCVVEALPNYNDAHNFAQAHPGKVFLAGYGNMDGQMMIWGDAPKQNASTRRTAEEAQELYTVRLDQYKCMQVSMKRFQNAVCLFPDPDGLVQEVLEKGQMVTRAVCKEVAFFHFTRTALIAEQDEEEKKFRRRVVKVGIDPHTSYANMLCDVAWARAHGTDTFILPDAGDATSSVAEPVAARMSTPTAKLIEHLSQLVEETCGNCVNRDPLTNACRELQATVRPADPGCWAYIARSS